jgi:hypothetical protein
MELPALINIPKDNLVQCVFPKVSCLFSHAFCGLATNTLLSYSPLLLILV